MALAMALALAMAMANLSIVISNELLELLFENKEVQFEQSDGSTISIKLEDPIPSLIYGLCHHCGNDPCESWN